MSPRNILNWPVWLVGFRPFFLLAFISGALLPPVWAAVFSGWLPWPNQSLSPVQWHAHEMLFGFGWAVLGGFLLTASKNWLKIRGMHGPLLMAAVLLWLFERILLPAWPGLFSLPIWLQWPVTNASVLLIAGYVIATLVKYRRQDNFKDNYFFVAALALLLVGKTMMLRPDTFTAGYSLTLGLFRLAFAVMFERTITQFMKNAMSAELLRSPYLDFPIKFLILVSAFQAFLPATLSSAILASAATLLFVRFWLWQPWVAFRRFEIGIMYAGYLGLVAHLFLEAAKPFGVFTFTGAIPVHVFTFLCMGLIIPAMLIRICQGHTGRKLVFTASDRAAIGMMGAAAFFRLAATQIWPSQYMTWNALAAAGWSLCFLIIGIRLAPFLLKARIDGRIH